MSCQLEDFISSDDAFEIPGWALQYPGWLVKFVCMEETPDSDRTVRMWEEEHGESSEGQEYLLLARLKKEDRNAFADRLCEDLSRGSAAALCLYGIERCSCPTAESPQVRAMDAAFQKSAAFKALKTGGESYRRLFQSEADRWRSIDRKEPDLVGDVAVAAKALGLTALNMACEMGFPAAFAAYSKYFFSFRSIQEMREDGKTIITQRLIWLLKGARLGIEDCILRLVRALRKGKFLPISVQEESDILSQTLKIASRGNWNALHELLLLMAARPGCMNLPVAHEILRLLESQSESSLDAAAYRLWSMYFGYFSAPRPQEAICEAKRLLGEASRGASQNAALTSLRCLCALHDFRMGEQKQALQTLRSCQKEGNNSTALALLAMLPHSGEDGGTLSLQDPNEATLQTLLELSSYHPRILVDYMWQALVSIQDYHLQIPWVAAMDMYAPPLGGQSYYMDGILYLHGFVWEPRDIDMALKSFVQAAGQHFLPALDMLADITGRGLYGCQQGLRYNGVDWVEAGCRHLAPRALVVYGMLHGHKDLKWRLENDCRLTDYTLEELFEWCGRQDQDALCLASHAIFLLEGVLSDARNTRDGQEKNASASLRERASLAGRKLADALRRGYAQADAGTLLYLGSELLRLVRQIGQDEAQAFSLATHTCLERLLRATGRKNSTQPLPDPSRIWALLACFCLSQSRALGEPKAQKPLSVLWHKLGKQQLLQDMEDLHLEEIGKRFVCLTNFVLV